MEEYVLCTLVDTGYGAGYGYPYQAGIAVDVDNMKVVVFFRREEDNDDVLETPNFQDMYRLFKEHLQDADEQTAEYMLEGAMLMAESVVERLQAEARAYEEAKRREAKRRAKEEELRQQCTATIGDEYDSEMIAKLRVAFDNSVGNDSKRCVPALLKVDDVFSVTREERNSLTGYANDITILVRRNGEPFDREYFISWPGAIFRSA